MSNPTAPAPAPLTIAEIRLVIEGRSNPTPTLTVRGRGLAGYHFYKSAAGIFTRRYVLDGVDPKRGILPLSEGRREWDDIQRRQGGFPIRCILLTVEELAAENAREAADRQQREDEQARVKAALEKAAEEERKAEELRKKALDRNPEIVGGGAGGDEKTPKPKRTPRAEKPKGLEALEKKVGLPT